MNRHQIIVRWGGEHEQEMSYSIMILTSLLHIKFLTAATPEEGSRNEIGVEERRKWGEGRVVKEGAFDI